jgi:hypothetical protein
VVGRFHGQAVLQRRILDCLPAVLSAVLSAVDSSKEEVITKGEARRAKVGTSAEIDRATAGIPADGCGGATPFASAKRLNMSNPGSLVNLLRLTEEGEEIKIKIRSTMKRETQKK